MAEYMSSSVIENETEELDALSCQSESIQGYLFEPLRRKRNVQSSDDSDSSDDAQSSEDERPERAGHNGW